MDYLTEALELIPSLPFSETSLRLFLTFFKVLVAIHVLSLHSTATSSKKIYGNAYMKTGRRTHHMDYMCICAKHWICSRKFFWVVYKESVRLQEPNDKRLHKVQIRSIQQEMKWKHATFSILHVTWQVLPNSITRKCSPFLSTQATLWKLGVRKARWILACKINYFSMSA